MRRTLLTGLIVTPLLIGSAHAENPGVHPAWRDALTCMNSHLTALIGSNESAETLYRVVRAQCVGQISLIEATAMRAAMSGPKNDGADEARNAIAFSLVNERIEGNLLSYVIRFKAAGGPPITP